MNGFLNSLISFIWFGIFILLPGGVFSVLVHVLLSMPMRRRDRALFFLDLIETVVNRGQSVEQAIVSAAKNRDRAIGVGFYLLAARIEGGAKMGEALEKVPGFLPPQVNAMLQAGEQLGDLKKVLPACREVLRVAPDTVRTTMHYMVAILLMFAPIAIWLIGTLSVFIIPKFKEVASVSNVALWPITTFVFHIIPELLWLEGILFLALLMVAFVYIGGPGFVRRFQFHSVPIVDWFAWHLPWKQKKLLRSFSAMLAVLLDNDVPETDALRLAGNSTANEICRRRAERVIRAVRNGTKLDEAIRMFDDTGEFHWRLTNANHANGGFMNALRGWHQALDAKAFQQEETVTHAVTSGLVILNGMVVALIATALFGVLVAILKRMLEI